MDSQILLGIVTGNLSIFMYFSDFMLWFIYLLFLWIFCNFFHQNLLRNGLAMHLARLPSVYQIEYVQIGRCGPAKSPGVNCWSLWWAHRSLISLSFFTNKIANYREHLGLHVSGFKPARFYILLMIITSASLALICTFWGYQLLNGWSLGLVLQIRNNLLIYGFNPTGSEF